MFEVAEAYEVMMGRWSRQLAPLFVEFVGVRDGEKVLDVGCGTGSLSATLASVTGASKIVGIDPSSGVVATTMWDRDRANELQQCLWDAAIAIDPTVNRSSGGRGSYGSAEALSGLLTGAGLTDIEVTDLTMPCQFFSFDELWQRYLGRSGAGPSGVYVAGLMEDRREAVKQRLRHDVLRGGTDGPFTLRAKAWAVRSVVP